MTCIDRLRELCPDWDEDQLYKYIEEHCPEDMYIAKAPSDCFTVGACEKCWERDISDALYNAPRWPQTVYFKAEDARRIERLERRLLKPPSDIIAAALKIYEDGLMAVDHSRQRGLYMSTSFELKE